MSSTDAEFLLLARARAALRFVGGSVAPLAQRSKAKLRHRVLFSERPGKYPSLPPLHPLGVLEYSYFVPKNHHLSNDHKKKTSRYMTGLQI